LNERERERGGKIASMGWKVKDNRKKRKGEKEVRFVVAL
jgi:hypothetical protein